MDEDEGERRAQPVDWLEQAADLPHLIARVSELVLSLGHAPDSLVILPRAELDRRELTAYSAGWADVVAEELPAVRRAYEERITAAYRQGQDDARTGGRSPRGRRDGQEREAGGEVIPLPYVGLLRPPSEVTQVERRGEHERTLADGGAALAPADPDPGRPGLLPSAHDVRHDRAARAQRRAVVRRNGRPSVPPLNRTADAARDGRDKARRTEPGDRPLPEPG